MEKPFDNEDRKRYHGLRVGDRVVPSSQLNKMPKEECDHGSVVDYFEGENNNVWVLWDGDVTAEDEVAEWLTIVQKVENR